MKCPKCNTLAIRRKGFHFDHEYRCPSCCHVWEPDTLTINRETWLVHSLCMGNGRSLIGIANSRANANALYKRMCIDIHGSNDVDWENFVKTIKKATSFNQIVIDLT